MTGASPMTPCKPIIFSGPMVRAILAGTKTQTRRVLNVPETHGHFVGIYAPGLSAVFAHNTTDMIDDVSIKLHGKGDLLWVREAWGVGTRPCPHQGWRDGIEYRADDDGSDRDFGIREVDADLSDIKHGWRSPIHMPRWASRITLEVTDVRVQRLQDISEDDAKAEGVERLKSGRGYYSAKHGRGAVHFGVYHDYATEAFADLWETIHGPDAWDANPWCCCVSFKRIM